MSTYKRVWINVYKQADGHPSIVAEPVEFVLAGVLEGWGPGQRTWAAAVDPKHGMQNEIVCFEWCHPTREAAIRAHVEKLAAVEATLAVELAKWKAELKEIDLLRTSLQASLEIEDMASKPDASRP